MSSQEIGNKLVLDVYHNGQATVPDIAKRTGLGAAVVMRRLMSSGPCNISNKYRLFSCNFATKVWGLTQGGRDKVKVLLGAP